MLTLSKQVAGVKTEEQLAAEEEAKQNQFAQLALAQAQAKQEAAAKLNVKSDAEIEEDEQR